MSVTLFVCLVFLSKILAYEYIDSYYGSTIKYIDNYSESAKFEEKDSNILPEDSSKSINYFGREKYIRKIISEHHANMNSINKEPVETNDGDNMKPDTDKESLNTDDSNAVISFPPYTQYEVTEIISDIPDTRTPAGPIVTNYTIRPPLLNIARPNNKTNEDKSTEANIKTKKNSFSILHINAEYDDKVNEVNGNKVFGILKGIKDYFRNVHRGIVSGIHSIFHKHDDKEKTDRAVDNVNQVESDIAEEFDKLHD